MKKVSIIIPVKEINDYIREAIPYHLDLDYDNYEIIIFPDDASSERFPNTKIIPSGKVGPAEKRDLALKYASGEIIAFIDDDAYPRKDWLKNAVKYFDDPAIGAVGGPAVTPNDDSILQKASGKVYESVLCSGKFVYRYIPDKKQEVDDYPSVNLIVRKDIFAEVGGFDSNYYPGEDTKLCLDITKKLGKKIIYDPDILVYHHRRKLFKAHLKQVTNYAQHRGYFAKVLPETSRRPAYFVPSLFVIGLSFGPIVCKIFPKLWKVYKSIIVFYIILVAGSIGRVKNLKLWILTFLGIFSTHVGYGIFFIRGLLSKKLIR